METKICSSCKLVLDTNKFNKCSKSKNGLQSVCKICKNKKLSDYYKLNPKKRYYNKEKQKDRYEKNKVTFNFSRRMRKSLNGIKEETINDKFTEISERWGLNYETKRITN